MSPLHLRFNHSPHNTCRAGNLARTFLDFGGGSLLVHRYLALTAHARRSYRVPKVERRKY